jgi:hypothetical protein
MQINHHSQKEHTKMSKITNIALQSLQIWYTFVVRKLLPFTHFSMLFPGIYFFWNA